jgi:hypothetical protein
VVPALAVYLLFRSHVMGGILLPVEVGYFREESAWVRGLTILTLLPRYLGLLVAPRTLSADYSRNVIPAAHQVDLQVVLGLLIALGLVGFVLAARRRAPEVALGGALLGIGMLPYLHFTMLMVVMAERFLYLPSVGFALAVGAGADRLATHVRRPAIVYCLIVILAIGYGLRTADRNRDWADDLTLWQATVLATPTSELARAELGRALCAADQPVEALPLLAAAARKAPGHAGFRHNLAVCALRAGHFADTLTIALEGQRQFPRDARFRVGAALARAGLGDAKGALTEAQAAHGLDPNPAITRLLGSLRARAAQTPR